MDSSGHLCLGLAPASVASADLAASSVATASPASAHPFAALGGRSGAARTARPAAARGGRSPPVQMLGGSPSAAFTPEDAAAAAAGSKRQRLLPRRATGDEEEADADGEPQTPPPSSGNFAFALQPSCWQERVVGWRVQAAQYTTGRLISGEVRALGRTFCRGAACAFGHPCVESRGPPGPCAPIPHDRVCGEKWTVPDLDLGGRLASGQPHALRDPVRERLARARGAASRRRRAGGREGRGGELGGVSCARRRRPDRVRAGGRRRRRFHGHRELHHVRGHASTRQPSRTRCLSPPCSHSGLSRAERQPNKTAYYFLLSTL